MASPVGPDLAPGMVALEEHEYAIRGLEDLKRLRKKQDSWNPGRIAFQNRIIPAALRFGTVAWLRFIVFRFCPGRHGRVIFARSGVDTLAGDIGKKFPHSGQVMGVGGSRNIVLCRRRLLAGHLSMN